MDDDDKIRRNLVVFSTGVLLVAWLNLPVQGMIEDAFKVKHQFSISPIRTWLAAAVVLLYMMLRYRFSGDGQSLSEGMSRLYSGTAFGRTQMIVGADAAKAMWSDGSKYINADALAAARSDFAEKNQIVSAPTLRYTIETMKQKGGRQIYWIGSVRVDVIGNTGEGPLKQVATYQLPYELTLTAQCTVVLGATYRSWVYSDASINQFLPVILAGAAAVVTCWKLYAAWGA